jgi:hypothetical protein
VADRGTLDEFIQAEDVVTGNPEYVADTELMQAIDDG